MIVVKKLFSLIFVLLILVACKTQEPQQQITQPPLQQTPQPFVQEPKVEAPPVQEVSPPTTKVPSVAPVIKTPSSPKVNEFVVEADDRGFYPTGDINVKKGDSVKITFKVRSDNVYYGGLEMKSDSVKIFDTGTIKPGQSGSVEFVADKSFTYSSWWPALSRKKQTAAVVVS
ncbi:MAG: hypothetical protein QW331_04725 [Candidatus Woesearchaeota archaeon]